MSTLFCATKIGKFDFFGPKIGFLINFYIETQPWQNKSAVYLTKYTKNIKVK